MGEYVRDLLLCQHYFQTLFTRIPKKVSDNIAEQLTGLGLPAQSRGNGGQGGPDRRGGDEGRARPASVKVSPPVLLFHPMHQFSHPKKRLILPHESVNSGSKFPKNG